MDVPASTSGTARIGLWSLVVLSALVTIALALDARHAGRFGWWGWSEQSQATIGLSVALALYAGTFLAYWRPRRLQARPFALVTALGLVLVSALLGLTSFWGCVDDSEAWLWSPLRDTLGLFFASSSECPGKAPVALQLASITALLGTLTTVVAAVARVFRDQWDRLSVRRKTVVVVVGLNTDSMRLVQVLAREQKRLIVGVDTEPGSPWAVEARSYGARVLIGNRADDSWIRTLRRSRIRAAYLLSPRPEENLAWFDAVKQLVEDRASGEGRSRESSRVIVRLDDRWEADHWRRKHVLQAGGVLVDTIGVLQVTAQELIRDADEQQVDVLVVLGATPLAAAVVDELAQRWREEETLESPRRFAVALVDERAPALLADHVFHEQTFGNPPLSLSVVAAPPEAHTIASQITAVATTGKSGVSVVVLDCREPSADTYRAAQRLAGAQPAWRILAQRQDVPGIDPNPILVNLVPFGQTLVTKEGVPEDGWTRIARRLHKAHVQSDRDEHDPARLPWTELHEFFRVSNMRQVASVLDIAERAGRTWGPGDGNREPKPLTPEEIAALAHVEHQNWLAYYTEHGWKLGAKESGDRRSPFLKPWGSLSEDERLATVVGVANTLEQLTTLGYTPFALAESTTSEVPARFRRRGEVVALRRDETWTWTSVSGDQMTAQPGDWLLTADDGRSWSVTDEAFRSTYRHVAGDQWERHGSVTARQAAGTEQVVTSEGVVTAGRGDWIVEDDEENVWVVPGTQFFDNYSDIS